MIVFPRVNAGHTRQPAWTEHLERLQRANVQRVYGDDVWPLMEPRASGGSLELPWVEITRRTDARVHC